MGVPGGLRNTLPGAICAPISWFRRNPGGTETADVARPEAGTFNQTHAPSYRQIIDLSDMNKSRFIGTLGQGGNPVGPHYANMQPMWRAGRVGSHYQRPRRLGAHPGPGTESQAVTEPSE